MGDHWRGEHAVGRVPGKTEGGGPCEVGAGCVDNVPEVMNVLGIHWLLVDQVFVVRQIQVNQASFSNNIYIAWVSDYSPIRMRKKYTRVNILRCVFILRCANQPESKFKLRSPVCICVRMRHLLTPSKICTPEYINTCVFLAHANWTNASCLFAMWYVSGKYRNKQ